MTEARSALLALLLVGLVGACSTHRPRGHTADAPALAAAIELRGPRGELRLQLAPRGPGRYAVLRPDGPPLEVSARADVLLVTGAAAADAAPVLELHHTPLGFAGDRLRVVVPDAHGFARILDDIGVTTFAADPLPAGNGTVGRDAAGTPILEAIGERDRVVVERPGGGERLATVHRLPEGPDRTLAAAVLAAEPLPVEVRSALVVYLLSR